MTQPYTIMVDKKKSLTPVYRGGYVNFFEPKELPNSTTLAWGMQCMYPKDGPGVAEWIADLKKIYVQVLIDKFGQAKAVDVAKVISAAKKFPMRDGDDPVTVASLSNAEQLAGHWFVNANNRFRQPYFIGPAGKKVDPATLSSDDIYSGAWYRAMLEFWYYDTAGNKGISCSLAAFMKVKDDANLGAGTTAVEAESAFGDYASEAVSVMDQMGDEEAATPSGDTKAQTPYDTDRFDFI